MTNSIETANQLLLVLQALVPALGRLIELTVRAKRRLVAPAVSYENLSLSLTLDLQDSEGRKAVVTRHQRVRFLTGEAGVITSPIWGDGDLRDGYEVAGHRNLGRREEGSRSVLLLGLNRRPAAGSRATLKAMRTIRDGFRRSTEYFESQVERPTRLLMLRVRFPINRPPREIYLNSGPGQREQKLTARVVDGRPAASWRLRNPSQYRVYSLRWSW